MSRFLKFWKSLSDWIFEGKRLPIIIIAFLVVAVTVTVAVVYHFNGPEDDLATVLVTVKGLGDKDFENRQIKIEDGDSVANVFSLKYEDIYNDFGQPLIRYNEIYSLLGVKKEEGKAFHITIDGRFDSNVEQAYLYHGQTMVISYY